MRFEAVIFDCDGVLVNSEALGIDIERKALATFGLHYEHKDFLTRFMGLSDDDFLKALDADRQSQLGEALPDHFETMVEDEKRCVYATELKPISGVAAFVAAMTMPKAVASSARIEALARNLHLTTLHDLFAPHIYSAELVENGKPAPDLYLFAAERLDRSPTSCLVIEDSENGVRAGVAAGMTVWGFTGGGHADQGLGDRLRAAGADLIFADYAALGTNPFRRTPHLPYGSTSLR